MTDVKLLTLGEYHRLEPKWQGYAQYMQGAWPGSELKNERNPYMPGSPEAEQWDAGQAHGVQVAQDSEE